MANSEQKTNRNTADDLAVFEAFANELEDYIISGSVYRPVIVFVAGGKHQMMMSGGDLLARLKSWQAAHTNLARAEKDRLNGIITQIETTKYELQSRFHDLLKRELKSRLDSQDWARDTRSEDGSNDVTPAEISNHLRLAAIREELGNDMPAEADDELDALEEQLQEALDQLKQEHPESA